MLRRSVLLLAGLLLLAGCYRPAPQPTIPPPPPTITPLPPDLPDVRAGGSALVGAVTELVIGSFAVTEPAYAVELSSTGTNTGFNRLCDGEAELVGAVRPISSDEVSTCTRNGVEWLEVVIAYDVLAVVGDAGDTFITCLTLDEISRIWGASAPNDWHLIREEFPPGAPLIVFAGDLAPAQTSFFAEAVGLQLLREDLVTPEDESVVQAVGRTPGSVSLVNYGTAQAGIAAGEVRALKVDMGEGCLAPEPQHIWAGAYRLFARPLYLYLNVAALRREAVAAFTAFYLSAEGQNLITQAGFLPASPESFTRARAAVAARSAR